MDTHPEQYSSRSLDFTFSALGTSPRMTLAVIVIDGNGNPRQAIVREPLTQLEQVEVGSESEVVGAVCQELRSIADNSAALRTFVDSLGEASWSLTLSDPIMLPATTLEAAIIEVCHAVLRPS